MGMNFSPMYQPVSTKTIKADGDLNINPYDLLATDVKCDTVEATEFVGGVGNFSSSISSSYIINLMISNEGISYGNIIGSTVNIGGSNPISVPSVSVPKNIGLFTVGNITGSAPNYQIIVTMPKNYSSQFRITCNGTTTSFAPPLGTGTYTFDTNVSVLEDLSASITLVSGGDLTAYMQIPEMYVTPAQ